MSTASTLVTPSPESASRDPPYGFVSMMLREAVSSSLCIGIGLYAYYSAGGGPQALLDAAIGFFVGLAISAYLPYTSQAHGNPDVSIASAIRNRSLKQITHRLPGQLIGWGLVPAIGLLLYTDNVPRSNYGVATAQPGTQWWIPFIWQLAALFVFATVALWATEITKNKLAGLALAISLGMLVYFTGPYGGGGINAAREAAPAVYSWADTRTTVDAALFWAAFIGGRIGSVLAGLVFRKTRG